MRGPGCSPDVEVTDGRPGCGPDVDIGIDDDLIVTGIAFLLRRELRWACSYRISVFRRRNRTNISHQECLFKESYAIGLTRRPSSLAKVGCIALTSTRGLPRLSLVFWGVSIFLDFFVRGLAILGPQRVCRLVLSLVGRVRRLVSRISSWRLELGHSGINEAIILGKTLISSRIASSGRLTSFLKESIEIRLLPNRELLLASTRSFI